MTRKNIWISSIAATLLLVYACSTVDRTHTDATEKHLAQVQREGNGMIYVDEIPCSTMMETDTTNSSTCFRCYVVGFIDSIAVTNTNTKENTEAGRYYQFNMQYDWTALVNKDSLKPVFYQPKQVLQGYRHEGILVFETLKDARPARLLYSDSYGSWGTQQFIISHSKSKDPTYAIGKK
jgi:hypothetical protein